jgi:hypothetical protein
MGLIIAAAISIVAAILLFGALIVSACILNRRNAKVVKHQRKREIHFENYGDRSRPVAHKNTTDLLSASTAVAAVEHTLSPAFISRKLKSLSTNSPENQNRRNSVFIKQLARSIASPTDPKSPDSASSPNRSMESDAHIPLSPDALSNSSTINIKRKSSTSTWEHNGNAEESSHVATQEYVPTRGDEIALNKGDIVVIHQIFNDGWYAEIDYALWIIL